MALQPIIPPQPPVPTIVRGALTQAARTAYELAYEVSPIVFHNGIAAAMPLQVLPIIALTGALATFNAVQRGQLSPDPNQFPYNFVPLPGSTVVNNQVGTYTFANQATAANAVINQPINISMLMLAPVNQNNGYALKLPLFTALITAMNKHRDLGGTFHIATPSYLFTDCILTNITDATGGDGYQQQTRWQLDFTKPLVTENQLSQVLNSVMSKIADGMQS